MNPSILITGASTGIGFACAEYLTQQNMHVFAGVRKEQDAENLQSEIGNSVTPVMLDVTDTESIQQALAIVEKQVNHKGLTGLVNNAGIAVSGPVEGVKIDDVRRQMEVNLIGQVAVTQAFLPLIRQATGRIINMGSIGGRSSTPFYGIYSASKFALEAITDSLRVELRPWGIHVAIIEPGAIKTPIWDKSEGVSEQFTEAIQSLYGKQLDQMEKINRSLNKNGISTQEVAKAVHHASTHQNPKNRYIIGSDANQRVWIERLPDRLRDWLFARVFHIPNF